ncbi:hypothetical protein BaRGS_00029482, partial [Batillaria attramentaria]
SYVPLHKDEIIFQYNVYEQDDHLRERRPAGTQTYGNVDQREHRPTGTQTNGNRILLKRLPPTITLFWGESEVAASSRRMAHIVDDWRSFCLLFKDMLSRVTAPNETGCLRPDTDRLPDVEFKMAHRTAKGHHEKGGSDYLCKFSSSMAGVRLTS